MTEGHILVYEDEDGRIRAYVRETGDAGVRVYDCWERCDFADLRKCVYEWLGTGVLDGVESSYSKIEEEEDMLNSMPIIDARRGRHGEVYIRVGYAEMGPAGRHAWGIKEA